MRHNCLLSSHVNSLCAYEDFQRTRRGEAKNNNSMAKRRNKTKKQAFVRRWTSRKRLSQESTLSICCLYFINRTRTGRKVASVSVPTSVTMRLPDPGRHNTHKLVFRVADPCVCRNDSFQRTLVQFFLVQLGLIEGSRGEIRETTVFILLPWWVLPTTYPALARGRNEPGRLNIVNQTSFKAISGQTAQMVYSIGSSDRTIATATAYVPMYLNPVRSVSPMFLPLTWKGQLSNKQVSSAFSSYVWPSSVWWF